MILNSLKSNRISLIIIWFYYLLKTCFRNKFKVCWTLTERSWPIKIWPLAAIHWLNTKSAMRNEQKCFVFTVDFEQVFVLWEKTFLYKYALSPHKQLSRKSFGRSCVTLSMRSLYVYYITLSLWVYSCFICEPAKFHLGLTVLKFLSIVSR